MQRSKGDAALAPWPFPTALRSLPADFPTLPPCMIPAMGKGRPRRGSVSVFAKLNFHGRHALLISLAHKTVALSLKMSEAIGPLIYL